MSEPLITVAHKALIDQINSEVEAQGMTKVELAQRLATSRTQVDRILGGENISIGTLQAVASVLGKKLKIELV